MDTRKIRKLIELVKETGIGELEVKSADESVRISCQSSLTTQPTTTHVVTPSAPQPAPAQAAEPAPEAPEKKSHDDGHKVKSPMVGTIYLAPTPGAKPFVAVGQHVTEGETICLIEAMKMFNKIEADATGVISARLIENEAPVEYDQPLFIIDTDG